MCVCVCENPMQKKKEMGHIPSLKLAIIPLFLDRTGEKNSVFMDECLTLHWPARLVHVNQHQLIDIATETTKDLGDKIIGSV